MTFTGHENHSINIEDAAKMTERYRKAESGGATLAGYFGKDTINRILDQEGCVGIRIYNALTDDNKEQFVIVGVTEDGEDMHKDEIADQMYQCPPYCPTASPLNGTA